eukprot:366413-Chlamydomonas_euryale.AAC.7
MARTNNSATSDGVQNTTLPRRTTHAPSRADSNYVHDRRGSSCMLTVLNYGTAPALLLVTALLSALCFLTCCPELRVVRLELCCMGRRCCAVCCVMVLLRTTRCTPGALLHGTALLCCLLRHGAAQDYALYAKSACVRPWRARGIVLPSRYGFGCFASAPTELTSSTAAAAATASAAALLPGNLLLALAGELCSRYASGDADIVSMLKDMSIVLIFTANPDGFTHHSRANS